MPRDFLSSQIRTNQLIASRSLSGGPSFLIISSSNADGSGGVSPPLGAGEDAFVFISGSKGSDAFVVLGGSAKVSGSLTVFNSVTFGDAITDTVSFVGRVDTNIVPETTNQYTLGIPSRKWIDTISLSGSFDHASVANRAVFNNQISGSIQRTAAGLSYLVAGSNVTISTGSNGQITISSTGGGGGGDVYWTSSVLDVATTTGSIEAVSGTFSGDVTVAGDLTVNGTTTTVNTQNLLVKDPVIYFGSGSVGLNSNGGIALASGSSVIDQALVWGRVANNTWGAGRLDVQNGTISDLTGMTLLPVRASKFELGGTNAYLSVVGGVSPILSGSGVVTIGSNALQAVDIHFGGSQFATIAPLGTDVKIGAAAGKKITISGSQVIAQTEPGLANAGFLMLTDTTPFISIVSGSATNSIAIRGEQSGNSLDLFNTNSATVNFAGAATSITVGAVGASAGSTTIRNKFSRSGNVTSTSWTLNGASANFGASTFTDTDGVGSIPARVAVSVSAPTFASSNSVTIGNAASLYVAPPVAGANTSFTNSYAAWINGSSLMGGNVIPSADVTHDLGSATVRWANIYTGDLHLKNDRGDYTIIEEEDCLTIRFNKTGKRYKFVLEPAPEFD